MKYVATLIFLAAFFSNAFGQRTFTTLNPSEKVYFISGRTNMAGNGHVTYMPHLHDTSFHGYRIDSVRVLNDSDTVYYFNRLKREALYGSPRTTVELDCDSSHWLGDYMIKRNKDEIYYSGINNGHSEMYYKTDALPGETWIFSNLTVPSIYATLDTTVARDKVLGIVDDIYTIHLNYDHMDGDPFNYDGRQIKVGKRSGFIKTIDHFHFPYDSNFYDLRGTEDSSLSRGLTPPNYFDIYDFEKGDEFHYKRKEVFINSSEESTRRFIVDSVYIKDNVRYYITKSPYCLGDSLVFQYKTIETDSNHGAKILPFTEVNYQYYQNGDHIISYECNSRNIFSEIVDRNECAGCSSDLYNSYSVVRSGLGQIFLEGYSGQPDGYGPLILTDTLVYYKKANRTQGVPLDEIECFVSTSNINGNNFVHIYPNPVLDLLYVDTDAKSYKINILTGTGLNVLSTEIYNANTFSTEINLSHLPSGIYFISILSESEIISKKVYKY